MPDPSPNTTEAPAREAKAYEPPPPLPAGLRRTALNVAGYLFTGLAVAGVFLPLVPATPFLLVAVACFARSSPRLHRWLLSNRAVGPYLEEWHLHRTVPIAAKRKAYLVALLGFTASFLLVPAPWMRVVVLVVACAVTIVIAWLPTSRPPARR